MNAGRGRLLLTPEARGQLVAPEAAAALPPGWDAAVCPLAELAPERLARNLALPPGRSAFPDVPSLFFCVNFRGLDKRGEAFRLWRRAGVPVAVWCVDNPWNLLSGLRDAFWKELFLFVTDASFLPGLKAAGAARALYLPLAADAARRANGAGAAPVAPPLRPLVFVGRSAFPDKERFFVGQSVPEETLATARVAAAAGERPDFFWWLRALAPDNEIGNEIGADGKIAEIGTDGKDGMDGKAGADGKGGEDGRTRPLWPGSAARRASLGAEECSVAWRTACLRASLDFGLTVFGDEGWKALHGGNGRPADLRGPLDYYGSLSRVYRDAEFSLAPTSFLLPAGLSQRHFDVWAAGGFCLTDASPGLALFPEELTAPVTFRTPEEIAELAARFRADPAARRALAGRWQAHIRAEHGYERRMAALIAAVFS